MPTTNSISSTSTSTSTSSGEEVVVAKALLIWEGRREGGREGHAGCRVRVRMGMG